MPLARPLIFMLGIMNDASISNIKIVFRVPQEDGSIQIETLWAHSLGNDEYRLDNSPFYAYSVSWEDIIYATSDPADPRPTFQKVIKKSGNRTVRIIFDLPAENGNSSDQILQELVAMGCSYEGATPSYMSINIPSEIALDTVCRYLTAKKTHWEHADPSYSELYP
jgi:hypothetical protein